MSHRRMLSRLTRRRETIRMLAPESCDTVTDRFEDRYIDVCTFRTRYWKAGSAGSAVVLLAGIGCSVLD
jgi:hypothetical protein